ncbi:gamma-soluble nsf attachment protein [Stylonychia lemnae]|uniref:Gamma-soluble NSF attachment protein n=1 Tax=Stylonychia lemnae TaxID=5949 RepID=A0A078A8K4_STYLE|nr:gamma-soluble nsf attachment protein [Stylonychia lemnae]|eukprot:CDW78605.1 gamma-soluble nsf attachment protein [Stylonychia lemnae]
MQKSLSNPIKEADDAFKKGEKAIKTGLLKWSADFAEGAMYFQQAAKAYKQLGEKDKAMQAYLKYSQCSEKINEFYGAAEGLAEAALFEKDKRKSFELLKQAQNFFKIQGAANQGTNFLKKFGQKLIESDDPESQNFALDIYETLFEEAFEGDNFVWNPDVVTDYVQILMKMQKYERAIAAKKRFIKYLKQTGSIDHQMRRAYLEILCIQIIAEDWYKIENTLQEFNDNYQGNAYGQDEYLICVELHDAVKAKDFKQIEKIAKKPIFSFIDIEVVRNLKKLAMNPPITDFSNQRDNNNSSNPPKSKDQILNNLLL